MIEVIQPETIEQPTDVFVQGAVTYTVCETQGNNFVLNTTTTVATPNPPQPSAGQPNEV